MTTEPEPGGEPLVEPVFNAATLRADLCQLAQSYAFPRGSKFVDELLRAYTVTRRKPRKNAAD